MKKISSFILTAGALILVASCAQELNVADPTPDNGKEINITVIATDKPAVDEGTKTFIDGTSVKWSDSGEKLKVFEVATPTEGDVVTTKATTSDGETTDGGTTMSFGVSMADKSSGYSSFDYYAVYPSSAFQSGDVVTAVALNTKGAQTPTATNFDASQDLLIAKKIENGASQASTLEMQFARVVAIGKMTIKNLETTDPITKITFSAKVGSEAVALAGRTSFNLETAKPVTEYASNTQDYSIILDYEGQNITANSSTGMVAYFTCYPFAINATTPGSFKVVVETATKSFMKEVNVSSAKGLAFNIGKASVFSVDMDGIAGVDKAVDLRYAFLELADMAGLTNSYSNQTVTKAHNDKWTAYAVSTDGCIGIKKNDTENDSYIKLPDFVEDIKSVVVTLKSPLADNTITLEDTATGKVGSIASLTTTDATVYTFNLGDDSGIKTAYFRSHGFQAKVEKIEVYAGTDNRETLDAPANVSATLNTDDANVTNSIDVEWDSVSGASSYVITLMDQNTDITTKVATSSPYTVTGLEYDMEYMISVYAVPTDPYVNKESSETDASSNVTTGAEPLGIIYYTEVTSAPSDWSGNYLIVYKTSETAGYVLTGVSSNIGQYTSVTISANGIVASDYSSYDVVIAKSGDNYTMKLGTDYLAYTLPAGTSKNNNLHTVASASDDGALWILSVGDAQNAYNEERYLRWNNNSGQYRFCCYTNSQQHISFYKLEDTRQAPGMSWSETSATATYSTGNNLSFTAPTLTPGNATGITYSSSDETIATINGSGDVSITALTGNDVKVGSTTISAIFAGNATYKAQTVSYTLSVADNRTAVATPSFSPAAGSYTSAQNVTISCATNDATIHYTIDGSVPTSSSTAYSSAIEVSSTTTIKAIAVKTGYKDSEIGTAVFTIGNDGSLDHPYTASEARTLALSGDEGSYYITGIVTKIQNQYSASYGTANFWIDENGTDQTVFEGYKIKYFGNVNWVEGNAEIAVDDEVIIYGTLTVYTNNNNSTPETSSGYLVSLNGKTKGLTLAAPTVTTNDSAKQITVAWTAATGTESAVSYVINCGTQSYNANAAGSHTFTMADYGTYNVSVEATASDAVSAAISTSATLSDPSSTTKDYYKLVTSISDITAGTYVVGALRSTSATNNFYFAKASVSSGDWVVSDAAITIAESNGVRKFEIANLPSGAVEFTLTGDNTNGFTISHGSDYLYYTAASNRKLAFAASGSSQKWKVSAKSSPLINGGVVLKAVGSQNYTISENSTATGAIRGYASTTEYRAIYLFKKVNE